MFRFFCLVCFLLFAFVIDINFTNAHSGRTDSKGGHTDHSTGKYHYHNSGKSGCN